MHEYFAQLPLEIIKHILQYNENFVIRHGKIFYIGKISYHDTRIQLLLKRPLIDMNRVTFSKRPGNRPGTIVWFFLISTQEFMYNEEVDEGELGEYVIELWKMEKVVGSYYNKVLSTIVTPIV